MKKRKAAVKKSTRRTRAARAPAPDRVEKRRPKTPEETHAAGRPGGLPDLNAKTDWEAEHDTWWRHG